MTMNAATLENSDRLRRVLAVLADGNERTTLDIIAYARVCAVNSCIAELRANGLDIRCRRQGDVWYYRLETPPEAA
jgi:hypothetical protein